MPQTKPTIPIIDQRSKATSSGDFCGRCELSILDVGGDLKGLLEKVDKLYIRLSD